MIFFLLKIVFKLLKKKKKLLNQKEKEEIKNILINLKIKEQEEEL